MEDPNAGEWGHGDSLWSFYKHTGTWLRTKGTNTRMRWNKRGENMIPNHWLYETKRQTPSQQQGRVQVAASSIGVCESQIGLVENLK